MKCDGGCVWNRICVKVTYSSNCYLVLIIDYFVAEGIQLLFVSECRY